MPRSGDGAGTLCIERRRHGDASGYLIKGLDDAMLAWAVAAVQAGKQIWPESQRGGPLVQLANAASPTVRR